MMETMTMHDRMLAVVLGREHDRIPFAMYEEMFLPSKPSSTWGVAISALYAILQYSGPSIPNAVSKGSFSERVRSNVSVMFSTRLRVTWKRSEYSSPPMIARRPQAFYRNSQ